MHVCAFCNIIYSTISRTYKQHFFALFASILKYLQMFKFMCSFDFYHQLFIWDLKPSYQYFDKIKIKTWQRHPLAGQNPTTISAEELNFRVRDGNGCGLFAIITRYSIFIKYTTITVIVFAYNCVMYLYTLPVIHLAYFVLTEYLK